MLRNKTMTKHSKLKLNKCPNCHSSNLIRVHISSARLPWWWYIECNECHWCGKTKLGLKRARRSWDKETKRFEENE